VSTNHSGETETLQPDAINQLDAEELLDLRFFGTQGERRLTPRVEFELFRLFLDGLLHIWDLDGVREEMWGGGARG
jgi:hypothetical protein